MRPFRAALWGAGIAAVHALAAPPPLLDKLKLPKGPITFTVTSVREGREARDRAFEKKYTMVMECWISGDRIRIEREQPGREGERLVTLFLGSQGYEFRKGDRQARETSPFSLMQAVMAASEIKPKEGGTREVMGAETVDGKACEVIKVTPPKPKEGGPSAMKPYKEWVWKGKGIVMKREIEQQVGDRFMRTTSTVTKLREGPIQDHFFSVQGMDIVKGRVGPGMRP